MRILLVLALTIFSTSVFAGGFEKNIMWSGKYGGIAGAATSSVTGSEALFWNPARLGESEAAQDLSFNASYLGGNFKGPPITDSTGAGITDNRSESANVASFVPAFMYRRTINEKVSIGAGLYVPAGTKVEYKNVKAADADAASATVKSDLAGLELGLGASYKMDDKHAFGASLRVLQVKAAFGSATTIVAGVPALADAQFKDLTGTGFGFKLGYAFTANEKLGIGVRYRSTIEIDTEGTGSTDVNRRDNDGFLANQGSGTVKVKTELPQSLNLGAHYKLSDTWNLYGDIWWTNYSAIKKLTFDYTVGTDATVNLEWKDMYNIRFAADYSGYEGMPIRFGYVATTPVSDEGYARATLTPPALAHTLTVGSGHSFNEAMTLNYALQYDIASKDVNATSGDSPLPPDGKYEATGYALHLGFDYNF